MSIKEKFDSFVKKNGCEPRYAIASVIFNDDKQRCDGYVFSFVKDKETERLDEWIFFYCDTLDDFILMSTEKGCEDFIVVEDSVEFSNVI